MFVCATCSGNSESRHDELILNCAVVSVVSGLLRAALFYAAEKAGVHCLCQIVHSQTAQVFFVA